MSIFPSRRFIAPSLLALWISATNFAADPLPPGAVARFGSTRLQDFTIDKSATFSPDGKLIATSGANSPICVWDVATGKLVRTHTNRGSVFDMRWRPDGTLAAITFFGHNAFLMQEFFSDRQPDKTEEAKIEEEARNKERRNAAPPAKQDRLNYCFLSADGSKAVAIWNDVDNTTQRAAIYKFRSNVSSSTAVADRTITLRSGQGTWLSLDTQFLLAHIAASKDQPQRIAAYDLTGAQDKPVWEFAVPGDINRRPDTCLSPDGKRVVVLFSDETVEQWDGPAGKRIRELPKLPFYYHHSNSEWRGIDMTRDGKRVALIHRNASGEMGGRIVEIETGKDICKLSPQPMPRLGGLSRFSADGKRVVQVGYGIVRIWDAETGAEVCPLPGHRGGVKSLVVAGDGKRVVSAGADLTVRAWDPTTGKEIWRTAFPQSVKVHLITSDAVIVQEDRWGETGPAQLIDPANGKAHPLPGKLREAIGDVLIAIAPGGKSVVSLEPKLPAFRVWSWPGGELQKSVPIKPPEKLTVKRCAAAAFDPEGKQFVAVMQYTNPNDFLQFRGEPDPPSVERWDLNAGKLIERLEKAADSSPILIPTPSSLLIQEKDHVRNAISGAVIAKLSFQPGITRNLRWLVGAALSPDRRTLAVLDSWGGGVVLFEMRTGTLRAALQVEGRYQSGLRFLPDGRLVSAGDTALVWDVRLPRGNVPVAESEMSDWWTALADKNPAQAWSAMTKLNQPGTFEFIRKRLRPVPKMSEEDMDRIFRKLDSNSFREREAASRELDALGRAAVSKVQVRLKPGVSEEVKKRVEQFLTKHSLTDFDTEELRALRAVEVLEAMGTDAAKQLLGELARGDGTARLTRDAAEAMQRLR
jgi:WD40 repeat protein